MKFAVLIHLLDWGLPDNMFDLDERLSFVSVENHPIGNLYEKLCFAENIDEGSPFGYRTALVLVDDLEDHSIFPSNSQYSLSTTFLNLLTILKNGTLGDCRVICSNDNFKTSRRTYMIYESQTETIDDLKAIGSIFDNETSSVLKIVWENLKMTYKSEVVKSRIENVLNFFYFSWHTLTLQQTGICLSIVLESLFTPHSNNELVHQISFNIAKFLGGTKNERLEKYRYVKKYYSVRSKLVHGEIISDEELSSIKGLFKFTCLLIQKIIIDRNLILIFNDNKARAKYLDEQLFS